MATLTITIIFSVGLLNIQLESDPQSLWVSKDSIGYEQEMDFNEHYGAFFRTEQIIFAQV
jgi:Niemann-Pick C1 protein